MAGWLTVWGWLSTFVLSLCLIECLLDWLTIKCLIVLFSGLASVCCLVDWVFDWLIDWSIGRGSSKASRIERVSSRPFVGLRTAKPVVPRPLLSCNEIIGAFFDLLSARWLIDCWIVGNFWEAIIWFPDQNFMKFFWLTPLSTWPFGWLMVWLTDGWCLIVLFFRFGLGILFGRLIDWLIDWLNVRSAMRLRVRKAIVCCPWPEFGKFLGFLDPWIDQLALGCAIVDWFGWSDVFVMLINWFGYAVNRLELIVWKFIIQWMSFSIYPLGVSVLGDRVANLLIVWWLFDWLVQLKYDHWLLFDWLTDSLIDCWTIGGCYSYMFACS